MIKATIRCTKCSRDHLVLNVASASDIVSCANCGELLVTLIKYAGSVYILSNRSMPDLIKIGFTTRGVHARAEEISGSTGVPSPFEVEAEWHSDAPQQDEQKLHNQLAHNRLHGGREFFKFSVEAGINIIAGILGRSPDYVKDIDLACRTPQALQSPSLEKSWRYEKKAVTNPAKIEEMRILRETIRKRIQVQYRE